MFPKKKKLSSKEIEKRLKKHYDWQRRSQENYRTKNQAKRKSIKENSKPSGNGKLRKSGRDKQLKKKPPKKLPKECRDWADQFDCCFVCGRSPETTFGIRLEFDHLCPGSGRKDDPRNAAMLCMSQIGPSCHHEKHNGFGLTYETLLWFKMTNDPENYDLPYLRSLRKSLVHVEPTAPEWTTPPWIERT